MTPTSPAVFSADVIRVLTCDRLELRLTVWHHVEVRSEVRLEGCDSIAPHGLARKDARQCLIVLIGAKRVLAHVDRRAPDPIARIFLPMKRPPPPEFAADYESCEYRNLLNVNQYLQSLAPKFEFNAIPNFLNA